MIGVSDTNGKQIDGLMRDPFGNGLSVNQPGLYTKYLKEKERLEEFERLKNDVVEIKDMMNKILKALNGTSKV